MTISSEQLIPLSSIPFSASFTSSLPLLNPHLQPKTPIFLLLRKAPDTPHLVAVTYIPSTAPVRAKTLFASTRASLVRELGLEKFTAGSVFVTEAAEVLDPQEWEDRDKGSGDIDSSILSREERELQGVKRAEDEERHGTKGRDLMGGGGTGEKGGAGSSVGVQMKMKDQGDKDALRAMAQGGESGGGMAVQFVSIGTYLFLCLCACRVWATANAGRSNAGHRYRHREPRAQLL